MSKAKVFMIMPFTQEFFAIFEILKREFEDKYEFFHAAAIGNQQNILEDIFLPIFECNVIIADLTGLNPNVLYELGVAHSFNKKVIIITQDDIDKLPFDLKQYRAKDYDNTFPRFSALIQHIGLNLSGATDGSIKYSNPINDFFYKNHINPFDLKTDLSKDSAQTPLTEKGYLDYMSEIEDNMNLVTEYLNHISEELGIFSEGINLSTQKIDQAKQTKTATVSFVKFQAKIVAGHMDRLSRELRDSNENISAKWNIIEKNSLDLFESEFSQRPENKESFVSFIRTIYDLKSSVIGSSEQTGEFKESLKGTMGLEASLNQQTKFLTGDLSNFINTHSQISNSIDRIIQKSRFIVGEIDLTGKES